MSGFVTRWPVRQDHTLGSDDRSADGMVRDGVLERWVAAAVSAYLERCTVLEAARERDGLDLRRRTGESPPAGRLGRPESVVVTARATEVWPRSFVVAVRVQPLGAEGDRAVDVACEVWLEDEAGGDPRELDRAVRDELIAIEHAAQHYN